MTVIPGEPRSGEGRGPRSVRQRDLSGESIVQIVPAGVISLDQLYLPGAIPSFETLLASDGNADVFVQFEPDQNVHAILLCETFNQVVPMFPGAAQDVVRDADIERTVSTAREDADVVEMASHGQSLAHCL